MSLKDCLFCFFPRLYLNSDWLKTKKRALFEEKCTRLGARLGTRFKTNKNNKVNKPQTKIVKTENPRNARRKWKDLESNAQCVNVLRYSFVQFISKTSFFTKNKKKSVKLLHFCVSKWEIDLKETENLDFMPPIWRDFLENWNYFVKSIQA